jgi:hypothetical protein
MRRLMAEPRETIVVAMEVKQPAALWAFKRRTHVSCLAFLLRDLSRPSRLGESVIKKSSSDGPSSSTIDQFGFSILTTTGVPLWLSFAHQSNEGAIVV